MISVLLDVGKEFSAFYLNPKPVYKERKSVDELPGAYDFVEQSTCRNYTANSHTFPKSSQLGFKKAAICV
jgi:hypothetical protein